MSGVWRIPTALALLSLVGLAAAILGDGVWHWICWAGLFIPLAVCAAKLWRQWPRAGA
ncbi:hypothetical protein [Azospirillum rugosum]|uniref:DUF4175 domain-containing protein n=1 Tax=Azospirillum rugosum TaxID=416170 RepID=A0ABS4SUI1_9PROT|nr:hypothetical protein [Azospirillum rugosum]MBP2296216.1 hypothetical protein [Azospirillum rugosum]MDQ0527099.1 hypothetical protein [Azospirillum rugosum]